jgi:predicted ArsR family transcriptional regulator
MDDADRPWELVRTVSEPQRRAVYDAVTAAAVPVTREQVATAVGISRTLAAFHLDKLVDAGLLDTSTERTGGGRLSKIGRPAKRYRRSDVEVAVTLPPRRYELAGRILARALAAAEDGEHAQDAARRIAREQARQLVAQLPAPDPAGEVEPLQAAETALAALGYLPARDGDRVALSNCPFHGLVEAAQDTTCRLNLALLDGVLEALGLRADVEAMLQPQSRGCCVTMRARSD